MCRFSSISLTGWPNASGKNRRHRLRRNCGLTRLPAEAIRRVRHPLRAKVTDMRRMLIILIACTGVAYTTGCMIGPDYRRPAVDVPQTWRFEDKEARDVANTTWWEQFNDPVLNQLIQSALQENKDLKIAAADRKSTRLNSSHHSISY